MPRGQRRLPERCVQLLGAAELIVHAGDLISTTVLEEIRSYGPPVVAVRGNVDEPALRRILPAATSFDFHGSTIAVIHDAGAAKGRLRRMRSRFPEADAVVFGHSHLPLHERSPHGFQIFNPGSPTERRRAPHRTMGLARVENDGLSFELVVLD
jgi:putative phosphoesterase